MTEGTPAKKKGLSPLAWIAIGCGGLILVGALALVVGAGFVFKKSKDFVEGMEENPAATLGKTFAAFNPDVEFVESDEDDGTVTFYNKKTDETFTLDTSDIKDGKFSITGAEGKIEFNGSEEGGGITIDGPDGTTRISGSAEEGGITVTNDAGETVMRIGTADPGELPAGLATYPGAELGGAYSGAQNGQQAGAVTMTTADSLDQVVQFYEKIFDQGKFTINSRTRSTQGATEVAILAAENGDGVTVQLMASHEDGKTQAVLNYAQKQ